MTLRELCQEICKTIDVRVPGAVDRAVVDWYSLPSPLSCDNEILNGDAVAEFRPYCEVKP